MLIVRAIASSRGTLTPSVVALFALALTALPASAQTLAVSSLTNASDADLHTEEGAPGPASLCDAERRSAGPSVTASTSTSFTTRFRHGMGADCGQVAGDEFMSHSIYYTVGFNATCPVGYRVSLGVQRLGQIICNKEEGNDRGEADISAVSVNASPALSSGALTLADPGGYPSGGCDNDEYTRINQSNSGSIVGISNGSAVGHTVQFTWSAFVNSQGFAFNSGDEGAVLVGLDTTFESFSSRYSGGYNGNACREGADVHFLAATLTCLCGNGTNDGAATGGGAGDGADAPAAAVAPQPASSSPAAPGSDGNGCTDDVCNAAAVLPADNTAPCSDGLFCNSADTCNAGSCTAHAGDPCSGPDGDGNCSNPATGDERLCGSRSQRLGGNGRLACNGGGTRRRHLPPAGDPALVPTATAMFGVATKEATPARRRPDGSPCTDGCSATVSTPALPAPVHNWRSGPRPDGDGNCQSRVTVATAAPPRGTVPAAMVSSARPTLVSAAIAISTPAIRARTGRRRRLRRVVRRGFEHLLGSRSERRHLHRRRLLQRPDTAAPVRAVSTRAIRVPDPTATATAPSRATRARPCAANDPDGAACNDGLLLRRHRRTLGACSYTGDLSRPRR
jgi:hypothetical protein